jgi:hypothetical protein
MHVKQQPRTPYAPAFATCGTMTIVLTKAAVRILNRLEAEGKIVFVARRSADHLVYRVGPLSPEASSP